MKSIFCKILWVVYAFVLGQGIYEVYGWLCGTARGVFGSGNVTVGALAAIGGVLVLLAVYILVVRVVERRWAVELAVPKIPKSLAMGWGIGVFVLLGIRCQYRVRTQPSATPSTSHMPMQDI